MRRRQRERPVDVPAELLEFRLEGWQLLVEDEPPVDHQYPELWRTLQAHKLWTDARQAWHLEHGWPGDHIDRLREQHQSRMRLYRTVGER